MEDPPEALSLAAKAVQAAPGDAALVWHGETLSADQLRERLAILDAAYAATEDRGSFAAYCLSQLVGPDRIALAVELGRRHVREGRIDAALSLAKKEELTGEARLRLLIALAGHFQAAGEIDRMEEATDEMLQIYTKLDGWVQGLVRADLADRLVAGGRLLEVVPLAHAAGGWRQSYDLSRAAAVFPNWKPAVMRDQALGLAQQQKPAEKSVALVRLAAEFMAAGEEDRSKGILESARAIALTLAGRDRALAFGALAEFAARRELPQEAAADIASAIEALLNELEDWEQTDALIELAGALAGTAAAPIAGPRLEQVSALLSPTAEHVEMRNQYRVYEFRGITAATSPARDYTAEERRALFAELIRLEAMTDEEDV